LQALVVGEVTTVLAVEAPHDGKDEDFDALLAEA
jgi:hypothetical protein